jgi:ABC-type Fe3+ transport system permease subunit
MNIYLPDWLYERTPYLYSAAGGATAFWGVNEVALISGILLIITAAAIWLMRRNYRKEQSALDKSIDARLNNSRRRR